ncbi:MAG: class I fructose-bisphosphate aldolase [Vulcanimicrobiaceae bacterium]
METDELKRVAGAMVAPGKGILAIDESTGTCNKRFAKLGIPETEAARRAYRELLLTAAGLGEYVSGAILYDETIRQSTSGGTPFVTVMQQAGILPGIKVDTGLVDLAFTDGEKVTQGLDGLRGRIGEYRGIGARFTKWRAVFAVDDRRPSDRAIHANAHALARYAAIVQEEGLVPIVEPEVLMDGSHDLARSFDVHVRVLKAVFDELEMMGVMLEGMVLKPSMVVPGSDTNEIVAPSIVAQATFDCLLESVPKEVAGVAFLSGGQSDELATEQLNECNRLATKAPWPLTFSFGRALQQAAISRWRGNPSNVAAAQAALLQRARCNGAAALGKYTRDIEENAPLFVRA